ncbi:hypothetical protein BJV82DRAFT_606941, partial [Fennellomyces sp. T-0311]
MTRNPCRECKRARKGCIWKNAEIQVCNRCSKLKHDCVSVDDKSIVPSVLHDDDQDLQTLWCIIIGLESEMQQMEATKTMVEQTLINNQHKDPVEWELSVTNGTMRLETPIRTMEELAMFAQASLRYLSPFSGMFNKHSIRFESPSISLTLGLSSVIQRHEMLNPRRKRYAMLSRRSNSAPETPAFDYRAIINHLVLIYLEHHNSVIGLVHQPTFLKYYRSLDDPLDSALTLAVCVDALARLRHLLKQSPSEVCFLSETFYSRCKGLLFDMYDDPAKKLEVIVVTSLLQQYLSDVLLNFIEANRLTTVALLACADLANCVNEMTPVERVLFQRNYFQLEVLNRTFKMLYEDKIDFAMPMDMIEMEVLDDEPEKTKMYMSLANHILRLLGSRFVSTIVGKINNIIYGQPCDLLFEDILRYEPIVMEWWGSLPAEYRICEDPFDLYAYKLVERKVSPKRLLPFIILHLLTGIFASSILQPRVLPLSENFVTMETIEMIRERSVSLTINSCRVLMSALDENWDPYASDMPSVSLTVMMYTAYCFEKLSCCNDIQFPSELLGLLAKNLRAKSKVLLPTGPIVPGSSSRLISFLQHPESSSYEIYELSPFPGDALLSDVLFTSTNRLMGQHFTVSYYL